MRATAIRTFHRLKAAAAVLAGVLVFGAAGVLALNPRGGSTYLAVMAGLIVIAMLTEGAGPRHPKPGVRRHRGHA